ncbi:MAG: hypothetical protein MRZ79_00095 [Bacteroidia bacterium]|nr:hypothetical protein [Bacteroidia bacterium]
MRTQILTIVFLLLGYSAFAQRNFVRNEQVTASADKITITFDIVPNGSHENFEVDLRTSNPSIRPRNGLTGVSRAGQYIKSGVGKRITWYFQEDGYTTSDLQGLRIYVVAIDPVDDGGNTSGRSTVAPPAPPSVFAGLGAAAATGLGLLTSGAISWSNSGPGSDEYNIYATVTNPEDPIYDSLANELGIIGRGDADGSYYDFLNKKYRRSQLMVYAGGAILIASAAIIVNRIRLNQKFKSGTLNGSIEISPDIRPGVMNGFAPGGLRGGTYGVGVSLRF